MTHNENKAHNENLNTLYFGTVILFLIIHCNFADKMNERQRSSTETSSESVKLDDREEKGLQCIASTFSLNFK